jgi:hypothetical protein
MEPGKLRVDDLWPILRDALRVPAVTDALGAPGDAEKATRVYLLDQEPAKPKESAVWGRIVVVPTSTPFDIEINESVMREVRWLALVEFTPYEGLDVPVAMAAVQRRIFDRWNGLAPGLVGAVVVGSVQLNRPAQDYPLRDAGTRMWYTSAEYGVRVAPQPTT